MKVSLSVLVTDKCQEIRLGTYHSAQLVRASQPLLEIRKVEWVGGWLGGWTDGWTFEGWMGGQIDRQTYRWMDRRASGQMDGWMD